jgi:ATP-binding cassette, subfamily B, multidrug efflux pump
VIALLRERLTPYWRQITLVIALLFVQAATNLYLPTLNADLINNGIAKADTHYILVTGAFMLGITLALVIATIIAVYWGSKTAMAFGRDVRGLLFRKVERFSQAELNHFGTPSLITRATNDVQQVQMLVLMMLNLTLAAPITAIGGIIMALRLNVPLSSVILVAVPVMGIFIGLVVTRAMPLFRSMQKKVDRVNQVTREVLSGVRVIRAFDRVGYEEQRFDVANADLTGTTLSAMRLFAAMIPAVTLILNLSTVAIVWFGSLLVANHGMPIGDLTAFITYVVLILMSVLMATFMLVMVPRASASAERIQQVLHADISVNDPATPVVDAPVRGHIEFRDVEFRYPGAQDPVLSHISFASGPGEVTAIVGSTGSGKSTLINLIPRFYDVTGGSVVVDGVDVREMALQDLWHRIGLVPQKAFLFSGSVADNLRYGDGEASDAELWHFLETAQGTDFVNEMPEGIEALVDQGGANVSGGQRQRLAIARALAKKAKIQIFDDSFSALDFTTDAKLRAALKKETTDATVLIVAQRVGTVMHADQIIVLENGTIAGKGTHEELLKTSETYREIVESQLGAEGVA